MKKILLFMLFAVILSNGYCTTQTKTILFDVNSYVPSLVELEKLSAVKNGHLFLLEGHTDHDGNDEYNIELSRKRVEAIKLALINLGIPASKIETSFYGEFKPVNTNFTDVDKQNNRRVEIYYDNDPLLAKEVKVQTYDVKRNNQVVISTENRITFTIQPGTFAEDVQLTIQEYFDPIDILSAKLTTETTDGKLLESGGMFYVEAKNKDGELLQPQQPIDLNIAALNLEDGYELFTGNRNEQMNMQWTSIDPFDQKELERSCRSDIAIEEVKDNTEMKSQFISEIGSVDYWNQMSYVELNINENHRYWYSVWVEYFKNLSNVLNTPNSTANILDNEFEIVLNFEEGMLQFNSNLDTIVSQNKFKEIKNSLMRYAERYKVPLTHNEHYVKFVHIPFILVDQPLAQDDTTDWATAAEIRSMNINFIVSASIPTINNEVSDFELDQVLNSVASDSTNTNSELVEAAYQAKAENTIINYVSSVASFQEIGWFNIDMLLKEGKNANINIVASNQTSFRILMKNYNSFISNYAYIKGNAVVSIPEKEPILIIATKYVDGKILMANKDVIAKTGKIDDLEFKVYNQAALKEEIISLTSSKQKPTAAK